MYLILPNIVTLAQYVLQTNNSQYNYNIQCPHCGSKKLWKNGHYCRKADRENSTEHSLNPIKIQRFLCKSCNKTFSALPECIPPKRWYLWSIQQIVFALFLIGKSITSISNICLPSRHTIRRWINHFQKLFELHRSVLCQHFVDLGRTNNFIDFWLDCFKKISLAKAMCICNFAGISIP